MSEIPYKVYKTRKGKIRVKYDCPACQTPLENELSEAGIQDSCPDCQRKFVVPGVERRLQVEADLKRKLEARKQAEQARAEEIRRQQAEAEAAEEAARQAAAQVANQPIASPAPVQAAAPTATAVPAAPQIEMAYAPPLDPAEAVSPHAASASGTMHRGSSTNNDYPALEFYSSVLKVLGWICIGLGVLFASFWVLTVFGIAIFASPMGLGRSSGEAIFGSLIFAVLTLLFWWTIALSMFVSSEFIRLALDARRDLARIAN